MSARSIIRFLPFILISCLSLHTPVYGNDSVTAFSPASDAFESELSQSAKLKQAIETSKLQCAEHPFDRTLRRRIAVLYSQSPDESDKAKAKSTFEQLEKEHEDSDSLMDLASCFYRTNFEETYKLCQKAARLNNGKEYTLSMIQLGLAGSCARKNDLAEAAKIYQDCLLSLTPHDPSVAPKLALAGLAGVYFHQKKYEESAKTYEELYKLNRDVYGADDVECGWSLLQESYAIAKMHKDDRDRPLYTRAIWVFRRCNFDHIVSEYEKKHSEKPSHETVTKINAAIFGAAGSESPPDPIAAGSSSYTAKVKVTHSEFFSPWKKNFKQTEAPGWVWFDPDVPVKYVLLCVPGLGLHHRSYESFARRVALEGVLTVAMDVRGFGTFVEANGFENLSMNDCVSDLKSIVRLLRQDYPNLPLFVSGESMGGALALRVVAEAPEAVDGLICSVPSGSRHKGLSTAIGVGANYLKNKRKPIPVGVKVVQQATTNTELQNSWINDPSSRLELSPQELLNFQKFMDENVVCARTVRNTPVILFQGHDDKLVREKGTLDLFDALATRQKSIVILGNTEHLIFESGQFKDDLTLGVIGWMSAHRRSDSPGESPGSLNAAAGAAAAPVPLPAPATSAGVEP